MSNSKKNDLYETLGVKPDATAEDIKQAYREQAKENHPDKTGADHAKMAELNKCYAILGNPEKRGRYDATGDVEDNPNSFESRFNQFVQEVFLNGVLEEQEDVENVDIIDVFSKYITAIIGQNTERKEEFTKKVNKLLNTHKRITSKGENLIARVLQRSIDKINKDIELTSDGIVFLQECQKHLQDYEYDWLKPQKREFRTSFRNPGGDTLDDILRSYGHTV